MDHSNLVDKGHPAGQCVPGTRPAHEPEWEDASEKRLEPNPSFLGFKTTYWHPAVRCCGKQMACYKEVQTRRCTSAG